MISMEYVWMCVYPLFNILLRFIVQAMLTFTLAGIYEVWIRVEKRISLKDRVDTYTVQSEKKVKSNTENEKNLHHENIRDMTVELSNISIGLSSILIFDFMFPILTYKYLHDYMISRLVLYMSFSTQIAFYFDMHIWPVNYRMGPGIALTMIQPIVVMSMYCVSYIIG